jgi:hypothetical protein
MSDNQINAGPDASLEQLVELTAEMRRSQAAQHEHSTLQQLAAMRQDVFGGVLRELVRFDLAQWAKEREAEQRGAAALPGEGRLSEHPPLSAVCIHDHVVTAARYALASPLFRGDGFDVAALRALIDRGPMV